METLHNGIVLPDEWPPRTERAATLEAMRVPYLERPPGVVPVDLGRQLLVDDFLVEENRMSRVFHRPVKHPGNPVFYTLTPAEKNDHLPPAALTSRWRPDSVAGTDAKGEPWICTTLPVRDGRAPDDTHPGTSPAATPICGTSSRARLWARTPETSRRSTINTGSAHRSMVRQPTQV
jgi:hypothetical protein